MVKSRPVRPPSDIYSLDKIDEGLTGGPLPLTAAKGGEDAFWGLSSVRLPGNNGSGAGPRRTPHAPSGFRGWCHDCQDELQGSFTALVTPSATARSTRRLFADL